MNVLDIIGIINREAKVLTSIEASVVVVIAVEKQTIDTIEIRYKR